IKRISEKYYMMYEFMLNHISAQSPYYLDFLEKKEASPYKDYFIRYNDYWPENRPTEADIDLIYKRKPKAPFVDAHFKDGTSEKVWCTFSEEQIDLNVKTEATRQFIKDTLSFLADKGASIIRLDAFAYAIKELDTNCFFVEPEIWEMLEYAVEILKPYGVTVLPEIHEHYTIQQKIAEKGYPVYDFALPMLVLHALYSGKAEKLLHWLEICPRNQFTTLDTHDGIGVVDVKDLLTQEEVDFAVEALYEKGANLKRIYSSEAYNNLDIYQINCTYYSALGNNDAAYLLARAIQCFTPGIPQIYYVGLLAGENDLELLENSKEGRNINRHYYSLDEINQEIERPVVKDLFRLLVFRNTAKAFDGDLKITMIDEGAFTLTWVTAEESASLTVDLPTNKFSILHRTAAGDEQIF
ncbi:MAG: sucrose phosphorylase, partial [Trichococcus flocculiformis]